MTVNISSVLDNCTIIKQHTPKHAPQENSFTELGLGHQFGWRSNDFPVCGRAKSRSRANGVRSSRRMVFALVVVKKVAAKTCTQRTPCAGSSSSPANARKAMTVSFSMKHHSDDALLADKGDLPSNCPQWQGFSDTFWITCQRR